MKCLQRLVSRLIVHSFLGITADERYGGLAMGYQAHCTVMEEISKASGVAPSPSSGFVNALDHCTHPYRQHWPLLRRSFPAMYQSALLEWHRRSEDTLSSWLNCRRESWSASYVGAFSRQRRCQYEKQGNESRRGLSAEWYEDVDYERKLVS